MIRDINSLGSQIRNELRTDKQPQARNTEADDKARSAPSGAAANVDQLQLSSEANSLRNIEQQLTKLPEVDEARVEALKLAIESGEYEINSSRIAEKLLQGDQLP